MMTTRLSWRRSELVCGTTLCATFGMRLTTWTEEKARQEMANKAKGKGSLNTGTQGIKKSGKK